MKRLLLSLLFLASAAHSQDVPLVAAYSMDAGTDPKILADSGPIKLDGEVRSGAKLVPEGVRGGALELSGEGGASSSARVRKSGLLNRIGSPLTISLWVKPTKLSKGDAAILAKRDAAWQGAPFEILMGNNGALGVQISNGQKWASVWLDKTLKLDTWTHVAFSHAPDGDFTIYVNGKERKRQKVGGSLAASDSALVLGWMTSMNFPGGTRAPFVGAIDELRIYGAALTPEQILADKDGPPLPSRAAQNSDFAAPTHFVNFRLARFDAPLPQTTGFGFTHARAERVAGPDAVDWPQFTLNKTPLWEKDGEEGRFLLLRDGDAARPQFRQPSDDTIMPGNFWVRPLKGFLQRAIVSSDRTVRTSEGTEAELWTFPVQIKGAGDADVHDVTLRNDGQIIYQNVGPLRSLTLLLPQNEVGKPYELSVAGRTARFDVGLRAIQSGNPKDELLPLDLALPGAPTITIKNAPQFSVQKSWDADLRRMNLALATRQTKDVLDARRLDAVKGFSTAPDAPALLAWWPMEPDKTDAANVADIGGSEREGKNDGALFAAGGQRDNALQFDGGKDKASFRLPALADTVSTLSVSFWVRADELPRGNPAILVSKRASVYTPTPFAVSLLPDGALRFEGNNGDWQTFNTSKKLPVGSWQHLVLTLQTGKEARLYVNGQSWGSKKLDDRPLVKSNDPLVLGFEQGADFPGGGRSGFVGALDEVRVFGAVLTAEQVAQEFAGTLAVKAAAPVALAPRTQALTQIAPRAPGWWERVGLEVPRSPLTIYSASLPHGMSGGHFLKSVHGPGIAFFNKGKRFPGSADDYAQYLADTGFDRVFEQAGTGAMESQTWPNLAAALKKRGLGLGLVPDVDWKRPFLTHPNVAFLAYNLPDWHDPLYRDLQLAAQRLNASGNFAGVSIGADGGNAYVPFWDWAPPGPQTPWAEAFRVQFGDKMPVVPKIFGGPATTREFLDYIAAHNQTQNQYGFFARAVSEVAPGAPTTTASYGPGGVGARGGYSWATNPAREMFAGLPLLQAYDWDETLAHKPLYNVASLDRLKSYFPDKPAWALMDDFYLKFGRQSRQRAYILALTRGAQAIGPNWLAQPSGDQARPEKVADQKELHAFLHRFGGAYANTRPNATIGILYVQEQSLLRRFNQTGDDKISDAELLAASHDGKTREALFMCLQAGWPAKLITPEEWKRGLPPEMKAVLLTGLTTTDGTWNWWDGLEPQLRAFTQGGGRLLLDGESKLPNGVSGTQTGLQIRGYITQGDGVTHGPSPDKTPLLYARNAQNVPLLQKAMEGIAPPLAQTGDPQIWAVPHTTGDVQYVTVVNNAVEAGQSTEAAFNPKTANLTWHTTRPIYDLRRGQKLSPETAKVADLTRDAFQTFALPPAEVTAPRLEIARDAANFPVATAQIGTGMRGVPLEFRVERDGQSTTIFGVSGTPTRLPLFARGDFQITATELLSGQKTETKWTQTADFQPALAPQPLAAFAARKDVPLVIALTPEQGKDAATTALAKRLATFYMGKGRQVQTRTLAPGEVVVGLQNTRGTQKFPQWTTIDADLVLLGDATSNPLIFDQKRGQLLDDTAGVKITFSPFVGERWALNLVASDAAGLGRVASEIAR